MSNDWLAQIEGLRSTAWAEVQRSPAYAAFKAFDETVVRLGGKSLTVADGASSEPVIRVRKPPQPVVKTGESPRMSHGDIAHMVLGTGEEPLSIHELYEAAVLFGADPKGTNPLANFRSAISRDKRFISVVRDLKYYWWFSDKPLPAKWIETTGEPRNGAPVASTLFSSQEGGGRDATTDFIG